MMRILPIVLALAASLPATPPNIVFVLFDDMGWGQPQSYNPQSALRTPNLDKLATQGMRFTDAHSASAVCTPTRYGVLTGRYPGRIGQFGVLATRSPPLIPPSRMTVASLLKQHGYATACFGKWHLGMNWGNRDAARKQMEVGDRMTEGPNALGFDYFCGYTHAANIQCVIEQDRCIAQIQPRESQPLLIKKAVEWIDGCAKKGVPFFLYFAMCPPHTPVVPAAEFVGKSDAKDLVLNDPRYGDWLYQGDAMLGQIVTALERNRLANNTLVIATSDNGAEHRPYAPLRESKRSIYEGGHRVPFVVRWPGKVKPGSVNDHTICLNDLMATAVEIVGAKLPDNAGEDSVSLVSEFLGTAKSPVREHGYIDRLAGTMFRFVSPDYFRLVPWDGTGLRPVGYGFESIEALVLAAQRVNAAAAGLKGKQALAARQRVLAEIDERGVLATPGDSWINELVTEAARLSIVQDGRSAFIEYEPAPRVRLRN